MMHYKIKYMITVSFCSFFVLVIIVLLYYELAKEAKELLKNIKRFEF
jgi:hypothetical protein